MASWSENVKFVEQLDVKYKCLKCKKYLRDPQQLKCGHRYCKFCLDLLLQQMHQRRCPACCEEDELPDAVKRSQLEIEEGILIPENAFADRAIQRELARLKCYCPFGKPCPWTGQYQQIEEHVTNQCEYAVVECPLKCGQRMARNTLSAHTNNDCQERETQCNYCNERPKAKDREGHLEVCPNVPVVCSGCLQKVQQSKLADHQNVNTGSCSRQYVPCPYGCKDQLNKDTMEKHKEQCLVSHLDIVREKFQAAGGGPLLGISFGGIAVMRGGSDSAVVVDTREGINGGGSTFNMFSNPIERKPDGIDIGAASICSSGYASSSVAITAATVPTSSQAIGVHQSYANRHEADSGLPTSGSTRPTLRSKLTVLNDDLIPAMTTAIRVLEYETKGCSDFVSKFKDYKKRQSEHTQLMEEKVKAIERRIQHKETRLTELSARLDVLEQVQYDGVLLWRISEFSRKKKDAISGKVTNVTSPPFFSSPTGYKMCARAYLNGDASAKGTHLSLFFILMKGPYDAILRWPFIQKVTIILLDQSNPKGHVKDSFQPDPTSQSFKRPTEMNIPTGCPQFFSLKDLEDPSRGYLKEDSIFIKMIVEKT